MPGREQWEAWLSQLQSALLSPRVPDEALQASLEQARAALPVPVIWLLGKTQAGKTSIIRALTGSERAEIGDGFRPCTRSSRFYDFPADMPVVRFLDTRGLGELAYDPEEDLRYCESHASLVLSVMKVADPGQEAIFSLLAGIRERHPDWPVVIAQTGLHECYPHGKGHPEPYPFDDGVHALPEYPDLARVLLAQRARLGRLPGEAPVQWVAVDLTQPEDALAPEHYGLEALWQAIEQVSSLDLHRQLMGDAAVRDVYARTAHQQIVGHALAAAGLGAMPVVDLVVVSAVQAKLLHALAHIHGQSWDRRRMAEFVALLGAGLAGSLLGRMLGRSVVKLIPVWGQTVGAVWGASASGATTYALGKAAAHYFEVRRRGGEVDPEHLRRVYDEAVTAGKRLVGRGKPKDGA